MPMIVLFHSVDARDEEDEEGSASGGRNTLSPEEDPATTTPRTSCLPVRGKDKVTPKTRQGVSMTN